MIAPCSRSFSRHRAQAEQLEAKVAAEAATHAERRFLANMSHELRTLLNAIFGFSELIHQGIRRGGWIDAT
ncbi:MAG: sensor histidine kinase [Rhodospirillales bacterium]|nr:sensor histidine kinase [Rhodospirillales bacterium]